MRMKQIFLSHTKKDKEFCDTFDNVCAREGIKCFRSEYEKIPRPAWKTIREAMKKSFAMFFLVGQELAKSQDSNDPEWRYTQNWIAYEIGLACQMGIDVWVICDDVLINFPIPYFNNYLTVSLRHRPTFDYLREILEEYKKGRTFPYPYIDDLGNYDVSCPNDDCKIEFNLHMSLQPGEKIRCPQCLNDMVFESGFLI